MKLVLSEINRGEAEGAEDLLAGWGRYGRFSPHPKQQPKQKNQIGSNPTNHCTMQHWNLMSCHLVIMSNDLRITGKYLNEKWGVGAKHALYHKDSSWYHVLERFPGALFDPHGYILFTTKTEYENCKYLKIGKHLSVPEGIYSIPGYVLVEKDGEEVFQILRTRESNPIWIVKEQKISSYRKEKMTSEIYRDVSDLGSPDPTRVKSTTYRILRDTSLARIIKAIHDCECQICGLTIELQDGQRYAEAHHIKPLGSPHYGPDVAENIICVCPNHHAQLDYGAILIDSSAIKIQNNHRLGKEFIAYHNEVIYQLT